MERPVLQPALTLLDFCRIANEKLVMAAIDLMDFTPAGINADKVGACADKVYLLEQHLATLTPEKIVALVESVRTGILEICQTGREIWATSNRRFMFDLPETFGQPLTLTLPTPAETPLSHRQAA